MSLRPRVAIVGGSLSGLRAAEQLRAVGYDGSLTVFGAEPHAPYNRPPLSKEILAADLGGDPVDLAGRTAFRQRASMGNVDFLTSCAVESTDLTNRTLRTATGDVHHFDGLVAATGLRPRHLAVPGPTQGRHVLRTVEDCHHLRSSLTKPRRVVVVGAGFIGCEVSATLRKLGHAVTVVEPAGRPMERVIGSEVSQAIQHHHEAQGVQFILDTGVIGFEGADRVSGAVLSGGVVLPADVVVESVGSLSNTEWLTGNELDLSDGVLTDNHLRVEHSLPMVAVGDVARFPNPLFDDVPRRVEHWSMPTETAKRAAATLVALLTGEAVGKTPFAPIPSFWSDQFDLRLQCFGSPALADEVRIEEGELDRLTSGLLVTYHRQDRHVGTLAVNLTGARQRTLREAFTTLVPAA